MTKTETYEEWAKGLFTKEPANMKLLVVVDKLLTGFDAPPCTYLYIDKSMQDHGLFQAICRVNRLDGEDQGFRLHRGLQEPVPQGGERHRRSTPPNWITVPAAPIPKCSCRTA
jgi:hypothetical protein